jgi:hypothetical protein
LAGYGNVPAEHLTIARHFNAGLAAEKDLSPARTADKRVCFQPSLRDSSSWWRFPALKRRAIFKQSLRDARTVDSLAGSRPLPELFAAAGCKFQFDAATIKPLIQLARTEVKKL